MQLASTSTEILRLTQLAPGVSLAMLAKLDPPTKAVATVAGSCGSRGDCSRLTETRTPEMLPPATASSCCSPER